MTEVSLICGEESPDAKELFDVCSLMFWLIIAEFLLVFKFSARKKCIFGQSQNSHMQTERFTKAKLLQTEVAKRVCRYMNITPSPTVKACFHPLKCLIWITLTCICTKFVTRKVFSHSLSEGGENENVRLKRTLVEVDLPSQT